MGHLTFWCVKSPLLPHISLRGVVGLYIDRCINPANLVFFLGNITRDSLTSVNECSIRGFDNGFLVIKVAQNSFHKVAQVLCNLLH